MVEMLLEDVGYRLYTTGREGPTGDVRKEGVLVPFAFLLTMSGSYARVAAVPDVLQRTVRVAAESGLLRRMAGVDERVSLLLDGRLYRPDAPEFTSESSVQRYLRGIKDMGFVGGAVPPLSTLPVAPQYGDPAVTSLLAEPQYGEFTRVLCGAALVYIDEQEAGEDALFDGEPSDDDLAEFAALVASEFGNAADGDLGVAVAGLFELFDVPDLAAIVMYTSHLGMLSARAHLQAPGRRVALVVSEHGEEDGAICEIRIAAFADGDSEPLFTFVWPTWVGDPDEASDAIVDAAGTLSASVIGIEGLCPMADCGECDEPGFRTPGGYVWHECGKGPRN